MAILDDIKQNYISYLPYAYPAAYPNAAAAQASIDSTQTVVDSLDNATLVVYNQMYLPMVFSGSESSYQSTYDNLATMSDSELRDGLMGLVLYYSIKNTPVQGPPDLRPNYTLMGRFDLQANIAEDPTLLSRSKITVSTPNTTYWPNGIPGQPITTPVNSKFNLGFSNWAGVVIPGSSSSYAQFKFQNDFDYANDIAFYGFNMVALDPSYEIPALGPVVVKNNWLPGDVNDWWSNAPEGYFSQIAWSEQEVLNDRPTSIDYINRNHSITPLDGIGTNTTATISMLTDIDDMSSLYNTDPNTVANVNIFSSQGAVPYLLLEARTYNGLSYEEFIVTTGATDIPANTWKAYHDNVISDNYPYPGAYMWRNMRPICAAWEWSIIMSFISKQDWPEVVKVVLRDPDTNNIVSSRNMKVMSNKIYIKNDNTSAYHIHLRETNKAYDYDRINDTGTDTTSSDFIRDPWIGQEYSLFKGVGQKTYIMEVVIPASNDQNLPASADIRPTFELPIMTVPYLLKMDKALPNLQNYIDNNVLDWFTGTTYGVPDRDNYIQRSFVINGIKQGVYHTPTDADIHLYTLMYQFGVGQSAQLLTRANISSNATMFTKMESLGLNQLPGYDTWKASVSSTNTWQSDPGLNTAIYEIQSNFTNFKNNPIVTGFTTPNFDYINDDKVMAGWSGNSTNPVIPTADLGMTGLAGFTQYDVPVIPNNTLYTRYESGGTNYLAFYFPVGPLTDEILAGYEFNIAFVNADFRKISDNLWVNGVTAGVVDPINYAGITPGVWRNASNRWSLFTNNANMTTNLGSLYNAATYRYTLQFRNVATQAVISSRSVTLSYP